MSEAAEPISQEKKNGAWNSVYSAMGDAITQIAFELGEAELELAMLKILISDSEHPYLDAVRALEQVDEGAEHLIIDRNRILNEQNYKSAQDEVEAIGRMALYKDAPDS